MPTAIGGFLHPLINMSFSGGPPVAADDITSQAERGRSLALPDISAHKATGPKLAVVGGGRSVADHLDTLKNWDGDIWSINGTWHWLNARGIKSTFLAVDPHAIVGSWAKGVTGKAIVATRSHPSVFEEFAKNNVEVTTYDIEAEEASGKTGSCTSTASVHLALKTGHSEVTFFGCEGSYDIGASHAYMHEKTPEEMLVLCGDGLFLTRPDYLVQVIQLRLLICTFPQFLKEQSGGFLRALIEHEQYRPVWISQSIADQLSPPLEPPTYGGRAAVPGLNARDEIAERLEKGFENLANSSEMFRDLLGKPDRAA